MLVGLVVTGFDTYNQDQVAHGGHAVGFLDYVREGDIWEAVFENWESEFLQMGAFVLLTVYLIQTRLGRVEGPRRARSRRRRPARRGPAPSTRRGRSGAAGSGCTSTRTRCCSRSSCCSSRRSSATRSVASTSTTPSSTSTARPTLSSWGYVLELAVLVRVVPELAERVPRRVRDRRAHDLPAPARLARVEAGRRAAPRRPVPEGREPPQRAWRHTRHRSPGRNTVVAPS